MESDGVIVPTSVTVAPFDGVVGDIRVEDAIDTHYWR